MDVKAVFKLDIRRGRRRVVVVCNRDNLLPLQEVAGNEVECKRSNKANHNEVNCNHENH